MSKVHVKLGNRSYEIIIEPGLLDNAGDAISTVHRGGTAAIVTNPKIAALYAPALMASLDTRGIPNALVTMPMGEKYKSLLSASRLYDYFLDMKLDRAGMVIALGGGVIGDLAGFASGTFLRGVDFVQIPTTLLAQVDASVGGKTAVNLPRGKNLVGVFHQPRLVLIDTDTLKTLPVRELRAGLAEVYKHGIIHDRRLLAYARDNASALLSAEPAALEKVIRESCRFKADVVRKDEREEGLRAILNFGHTFAHAIEAATKYRQFRHGEAVSMGMIAAAQLSDDLGISSPVVRPEIEEALSAARLPVRIPAALNADELIGHMGLDKKVMAGRKRFVLLRGIGEPEIVEGINAASLKQAIRAVQG